ncbi:hypothetical protein [Streptomyces sp. TP-A0875]|uniref:hypothetical protein n=1 Tax=Streptomyces sp. TP-A0875 TaxID=552354 RepID=UPI00099BCA1A|nr:hypothetical protein [Streptomyces sp. TP-A0875]
MSAIPQWLMPHRITVEPYEGDGAYGPTYGPGAEVAALVVEARKRVHDREGRAAVATAQIITAPGLSCPPESRVTLPSGRVTRALAVTNYTAPGLPVPECTEVMCQ